MADSSKFLSDVKKILAAQERGIFGEETAVDKIKDICRSLDGVYSRKGQMITETMGWCVLCGENPVDTSDGTDTCNTCCKEM